MTGSGKGLSIQGMIPNAITVMATCAALTGMRFAIEGNWGFAVGAVILAAVLDALDGRMARLLNAASEFGKQLDSLSDFVSFGVVPAMILYFWRLNELGGAGWALCLFLAVCCGLRLARFNSRIDSLPSYAFNYFQGVPAPMGAGLSLAPVAVGLAFGEGAGAPLWFAAFWTVLIGVLMVSELPTYSFKKVSIPRRFILPAMAAIAVLAAALAGQPWVTLLSVGAAYMLTFPFSYMSYKKLKREAEKRQTEAEQSADAREEENGNTEGDAHGDAESSKAPPAPSLREVK